MLLMIPPPPRVLSSTKMQIFTIILLPLILLVFEKFADEGHKKALF